MQQDTKHLTPVLKAFLGSLRDLCISQDQVEKPSVAEPNARLQGFVSPTENKLKKKLQGRGGTGRKGAGGRVGDGGEGGECIKGDAKKRTTIVSKETYYIRM